MKTNLLDVVEIVENNNDFILLEFTGNRKEMILTGILNGNEDMIRVTKGANHTLTQYNKDGSHFSFNWGESGYTLVSDECERKKRAIESLIEDDLETSLSKADQRNLPQSKADVKGMSATFKLMHFKGDDNICVHKNNSYYKHISNQYLFEVGLLDKYEEIETIGEYTAPNGCYVENIIAKGRK